MNIPLHLLLIRNTVLSFFWRAHLCTRVQWPLPLPILLRATWLKLKPHHHVRIFYDCGTPLSTLSTLVPPVKIIEYGLFCSNPSSETTTSRAEWLSSSCLAICEDSHLGHTHFLPTVVAPGFTKLIESVFQIVSSWGDAIFILYKDYDYMILYVMWDSLIFTSTLPV